MILAIFIQYINSDQKKYKLEKLKKTSFEIEKNLIQYLVIICKLLLSIE